MNDVTATMVNPFDQVVSSASFMADHANRADHQTNDTARAVLNVFVGSSTLPILVQLDDLKGKPGYVPFKSVFVDRMDYDPAIKRCETQFKIPRARIEKALARNHHFRPDQKFNLHTDMNSQSTLIRKLLHTPQLQDQARIDGQGSNGLPAIGGVHFVANLAEFSAWIRGSVNDLLNFAGQQNSNVLNLSQGLLVRIITTFSGGTGTGAFQYTAAAIRHELQNWNNLTIDGVVVLPGANADLQSKANAFAALQSLSAAHSYDGSVRLSDEDVVKRPFDSITVFTHTNGTQVFDLQTMLAQVAMQSRLMLQAATQGSIIAGLAVDLTAVSSMDHRGIATCFGREFVTRITLTPDSINELEASSVLYAGITQRQIRFEEFRERGGRLEDSESRQVDTLLDTLQKDLGITPEGLANRLEGQHDSYGNIVRLLEGLGLELSSDLSVEQMKSLVPEQMQDLRDLLNGFKQSWEDEARQSSKSLPSKIVQRLRESLAHHPHLLIAAIQRMISRMHRLFDQIHAGHQTAEAKRIHLGEQLREDISQLEQSGGFLFRSRRVVSDCASRVIETARLYAEQRILQERAELLLRAEMREAFIQGLLKAETELTTHILSQGADWREHLQAVIQDESCRVDWATGPFDWAVREAGEGKLQGARTVREQAEMIFVKSQAIQHQVDELYRQKITWREARMAIRDLVPSAKRIDDLEDAVLRDERYYRSVIQRLRMPVPAPLDTNVKARVRPDPQGRHTLKIIMLPEGGDTPLARKLNSDLQEAGVAIRFVRAPEGEQAITLYYSERGLPASAFVASHQLRDSYEKHVNIGGQSPHLTADDRRLPKLMPPVANAAEDAQRAIVLTLALGLEGKVTHRPYEDEYTLRFRHRQPSDNSRKDEPFWVEKTDSFNGLQQAASELAKATDTLFWYEADINTTLRAARTSEEALQPAVDKLVAAYHATRQEPIKNRIIERLLFDFKVDPNNIKQPSLLAVQSMTA